MGVTQKLEQLAEQFDIPRRIIKDFARFYNDDPQAARKLAEDLRAISDWLPNGRTRRAPTNFDRLVEMFRADDNPWLTKTEMAGHSGLTLNSLHTAFYERRDHFDSRPHPDGGRAGQYRLKKAVFDADSEAERRGEQ